MSTRTRVQAKPPEVTPADLPLHVKYRPATLKEVRGQGHVTKSLAEALARATKPHAFLFTGPSGTGKTTMARIVASMLGCDPANILDTDAATNNGIEAMRDITSTLRYQGFGDTPNKFIIIDEAHALSKAAWQSLLKSVEEPPAHVFFAFCTTEPSKVPDTIRTRCMAYDMKPVKFDDLMDLLEDVCDAEGMDTPSRYLEQVARAAEGSPRQALMYLATIADTTDDGEVSVLLSSPLDNAEVIDLCRLLVRGEATMAKVIAMVKSMGDMPAESIRIVVTAYLTKCLEGVKTDKEAVRLLDMMAAFSKPFNASDKTAPLYLAFGDILFR